MFKTPRLGGEGGPATEHGLNPNQISQWKRQLLEKGPSVFSGSAVREQRQQEASQVELFEQIGRLRMELELLKKRLLDRVEVKRMIIEASHAAISIRRQCRPWSIGRRGTASIRVRSSSLLPIRRPGEESFLISRSRGVIYCVLESRMRLSTTVTEALCRRRGRCSHICWRSTSWRRSSSGSPNREKSLTSFR